MIASDSSSAFAHLVERVYGGKISVALAKRVWDASSNGQTGISLGSISDDEREQLTQCLKPGGLLVMEFGQLYLPRFAAMEARIADSLLRRHRAVQIDQIDYQSLIQSTAPTANAEQIRAILAGLTQQLLLLTGGPGTGKSFTLRALCAVLKLQNLNCRIAAVAPTANAAQRLADVGATHVGTIHKLLGLSPRGNHAVSSTALPLAFDAVIVDEASMLSTQLADLLFARLGPDTRLILAGDRNQLASIDAGEVFSQACVLSSSVITLTQNRRFENLDALTQLARGILDPATDADQIHQLAQPFMRPELQSFDALIHYAIEQYRRCDFDVAQLMGRFRLITATNDGPFGVNPINAAIDRAMRLSANAMRDSVWYSGRLIVILRNDPSTGLRNGQVGVCVRVDQQFMVRFDDDREFAVERIALHSSAWAITVHKSQGAEYDDVLFVLPSAASVMTSPSLIYTAITRAKANLSIVGDQSIWDQAIVRSLSKNANGTTSNSSGLVARLVEGSQWN